MKKPTSSTLFKKSAVCASICTILNSGFASAQEEQVQEGQLEVIEITSQKRVQRSQDVPLSVEAFSERDLKNLGVVTASDITENVTNVQLNAAGGNGNQIVTIRGIGLNDFGLNSTPTAAIHVDEIALGSNAMSNFAVFDLERVEVLKGPQGTLFGRNSTAGVVNFIVQKPSDVFEGYATLTLGNYSTTNFEGAVGGPISENFSYRASLKSESTSEGFQTNTNTDVDWRENGEIDRWAGRFQLAYDSGDFRALFKYQAGEDKSEPWLPQAEGLYAADGSFCASGIAGNPNPNQCFIGGLFGASYQMISDTDGDVHSGSYNFEPSADDEFSGASLRLELDVDGGTFVSLTGMDEMTYIHNTDLDGVGFVDYQDLAVGIVALADSLGLTDEQWLTEIGLDPFGTRAIAENPDFQRGNILNQLENFEIDQFSQEFRFTSEGGQRFNYLFGAYYSSDDIKNTTGYQSDGFSLFLGLPLQGAIYNYEFEQENTSYAIFGQGDYALTDATTLTFGARYTKDEKQFISSSFGTHPDMAAFLDAAFGVPNTDQLPILPDLFGFGLDNSLPTSSIDGFSAELIDGGSKLKQKVEFSNLSWKLTLDHKIEDDWMVYASVADGFNAGGFPAVIITACLFEATPYDEETIMAYEIGSKLTALNNSLRLNASLFYYDYSDLQGVYATAVGFDRLQRIGDADVYGIEVDGTWVLTDSLQWRFGFATLDTEVVNGATDAVDASGTNPRAPVSLFEGNNLAHAPEFTANSSLNYEADISDDLYLTFQANVSYRSDYYTRFDGTPISKWDDSSMVVGFRATLNDMDDVWQVALWGKNITNEEFATYQSFSLDKGDQFIFFNAPATYGIDFTYRFGN